LALPAGILRFTDRLSGPVVVIASHGRSSLRRVALARVAMDVARRSLHPVLVVPAGPFVGVE
jgi:nucleotide-binding universal stress UspA family protein